MNSSSESRAPGTLLIQCRLHKTKKHTVRVTVTVRPEITARVRRVRVRVTVRVRPVSSNLTFVTLLFPYVAP